MSFGGVVAERVFGRAEDLFGWRVGEGFRHLAHSLFQKRAEAFQELLDARLAVFFRCGDGVVGVGHDTLTGGMLLLQH